MSKCDGSIFYISGCCLLWWGLVVVRNRGRFSRCDPRCSKHHDALVYHNTTVVQHIEYSANSLQCSCICLHDEQIDKHSKNT